MDNFKIELPAGLLEKTLSRIHREKRILFAKKVIVFFGLILFAVGFTPWLTAFQSNGRQDSALSLQRQEPFEYQSILVLDEQSKNIPVQYGRNPYKYSIITTGR